MVCWKLFERKRGVHQVGIRTPHHWRIWNEAVATPHHASFSHVTRGYNAVQSGRETPRKYAINWQGAYLTNLQLRYAVSSPPPTLNGDHLSDMVLKRHQHWGVGGGRGANIVHALGPVFSILKWVVSQLVLRGIVSCWHPVESDYTGYIGEPLSTDRWPTGARLTNP